MFAVTAACKSSAMRAAISASGAPLLPPGPLPNFSVAAAAVVVSAAFSVLTALTANAVADTTMTLAITPAKILANLLFFIFPTLLFIVLGYLLTSVYAPNVTAE